MPKQSPFTAPLLLRAFAGLLPWIVILFAVFGLGGLGRSGRTEPWLFGREACRLASGRRGVVKFRGREEMDKYMLYLKREEEEGYPSYGVDFVEADGLLL